MQFAKFSLPWRQKSEEWKLSLLRWLDTLLEGNNSFRYLSTTSSFSWLFSVCSKSKDISWHILVGAMMVQHSCNRLEGSSGISSDPRVTATIIIMLIKQDLRECPPRVIFHLCFNASMQFGDDYLGFYNLQTFPPIHFSPCNLFLILLYHARCLNFF